MKIKLTILPLLALANGIILVLPSFCAADSKTNTLEQAKEAEPFKIIVTFSKKQVHIKESFKIALEVKNVVNTTNSFGVMSCSWEEHWRSDNPTLGSVTLVECAWNSPVKVNLAPGESYKKELDMQIFHPVSTNKISFHMGFTPMNYTPAHSENGRFIPSIEKGGQKTYWSDEMILEVIQ